MDAALLIIGLVLILMAFAPVAPSCTPPSRGGQPGLRTRIARQIHLWDRYLGSLQCGGRAEWPPC